MSRLEHSTSTAIGLSLSAALRINLEPNGDGYPNGYGYNTIQYTNRYTYNKLGTLTEHPSASSSSNKAKATLYRLVEDLLQLAGRLANSWGS